MTTKDLRCLMPQDSQDVATAHKFVSLGAEAVSPVVTEMLRQLSDLRSPVAQVYWEFFAQSGETLAEDVSQFLHRDGMNYQKYIIVGLVLPAWSRDSVSLCKDQLKQLVTANSGTFDTDLRSIQLLAKHRLAEREWLRGLLDFKRQSLSRLALLLEEVAADL